MTAPTDEPNYNPNVPLSDNNIAHRALDATSSLGNHEVIQLVDQTNNLSTDFQEVSFYAKKVPNQTDQIFMRYPRNGKEFQITEYQIYELQIVTVGEPPNQTIVQYQYFTFLPGGIIVYFGHVIPNQQEFTLQLNPAICSNIMGVNLCVIGQQTSISTAYPSNVSIIGVNGKTTGLLLTNSTEFEITPQPQFYLIFGNI
jgi:hypothetical protein